MTNLAHTKDLLLWSMPMAGLRCLWLAMTRSFTTGGKKVLEENGIRTKFVENLGYKAHGCLCLYRQYGKSILMGSNFKQ